MLTVKKTDRSAVGGPHDPASVPPLRRSPTWCPASSEFLEAEGMGYAIRLPANRVLQDKIGYLLKRTVGRPPQEVRRYYSSFSYRAGSWSSRRCGPVPC